HLEGEHQYTVAGHGRAARGRHANRGLAHAGSATKEAVFSPSPSARAAVEILKSDGDARVLVTTLDGGNQIIGRLWHLPESFAGGPALGHEIVDRARGIRQELRGACCLVVHGTGYLLAGCPNRPTVGKLLQSVRDVGNVGNGASKFAGLEVLDHASRAVKRHV